ncbi:hypothetical protein L6164_035633 [Bauhinia variegata]|uniref:Uncharacterized protein n=1 Tax=Bauhinia variegata TaxID=167791 RepID=A0ACB9KEP1_BAUVA|nr:hypothetical protein L6164_035633 [Bauhinia variegata]
MKPMNTIYDLLEEAKVRTVWWALCIFATTYFFTHTSKSMWMNIPMSILFVSALRILFNNVEFRWKVQVPRSQTYLSHLEKKQLSLNDSRLSSTTSNPAKWKRKIGSPIVENAMGDFIDKLLKDFVVDLWYSEITPDKEAPELIREIIMDALAEISARVKEINIVDLLTRDIVDLIGDHLDLFRRNQAAIGVDVMLTLSSEERDERLKYHLLNSKELHPALISPESEYKVLQRLMGGVLAIVLRPREAQCPIVRSIARELLTCLVMQPIMNLASPGYINELIETLMLLMNEEGANWFGGDQSTNATSHNHGHSVVAAGVPGDLASSNKNLSVKQGADMTSAKMRYLGGATTQHSTLQQESLQVKPADWAQMLEVATQRRTEVLMPENLENMWTKGRNYKKKEKKNTKASFQDPPTKIPVPDNSLPDKNLLSSKPGIHAVQEGKSMLPPIHAMGSDPLLNVGTTNASQSSQDPSKELSIERGYRVGEVKDTNSLTSNGYKSRLKKSNSTSDLTIQAVKEGPIISEFYSPDLERHTEGFRGKSASDMVIRREGQLVPKLKCRVMGAYFEKLGSKSFAVYSIAVTDAENRTWFVKRRYRNFERLHRHLKDIPNYTLHLPPKRIFSSSTEDAFVHQRCIQLDKYLQDLLSIANVAEQHEVWDFLSASSKNYSFGKSSSMMKTLAVNVDDAVDDIVRQFKGVSDGLMRKVVGTPSPPHDGSSTSTTWNLSWNADETDRSIPRQVTAETVLSSDTEEGGNLVQDDIDKAATQASEWHSDNELSSKGYPSQVINHAEESGWLDPDKKLNVMVEAGVGKDVPITNFTLLPNNLDPVGMPPEWTPPNVSVPILNLVDKIFQLKKRGWLRRQVFWISKQILQLVMEDAIDDFLLRHIHWLRKEGTIAQGIRWLQDVLWPGGTFFLKVGTPQVVIGGGGIDQNHFQKVNEHGGSKISKSGSGSFEQQLEAARRASDVKKMLFDGAPTTLVSLVGQKQYRRCARDIYYFSQSNICVKQLGYAILELLLISIFPEMRDLVVIVHQSR